MHLPDTAARVPRHTPAPYNQRIARTIEHSIAWHREHPEEIPERLRELDEEWDIERVLETQAASLVLAGTALGLLLDRRLLTLPVIVAGFLLQHALSGWCPPLPLLRRLGVRTEAEIQRERQALEALSLTLH